MRKTLIAIAAALVAGSVLAVPAATAIAQPARACLQNNRIWSWNVLDDRTLVVTDRSNRPFIVRLGGGCVGLTNANLRIAFRTWMSLSCLKRGDEVRFVDPALGRMSCFVRDVQPYGPYARNQYDPRRNFSPPPSRVY